jgi:GAF domain-containing protein
MTRRSSGSGKQAKAPHRKAEVPKRSDGSTVRRRSSSAASLKTEVVHLRRERDEALEQLSAASNVLNVISSSPSALKPVLSTILQNATRICQAKFANLYLFDGKNFDFGAQVGTRPREYVEFQAKRGPFIPIPGGRLERVVRTKKLSVTADYSAEVVKGPAADLGGARSTVHVPMLKGDTLVGAIIIYRTEVRPFTEKQIALVQSFAAQAVIAIENTRLINELRQSLEQQTATADVLRVISSSPGDLKLVFQAMLENAVRICDARFGLLTSYEGDNVFRTVAMYNLPPAWAQSIAELRHGFRAHPQSAHGRVATMKQFVQVQDYTEGPAYKERDPTAVETAELGGVRTIVTVPMLKGEALVGAISIYRQEVRPFTDKQIALLQNFADQSCYRYREHAAAK